MKRIHLVMLLISQLAFIPKFFGQNIAINEIGNLPDTSAILDVSSITKGFLTPRMTTTQQNSIPLPAKGLLIYNITDNTFKVNTGSSTSPVWSTVLFVTNTTNTINSSVNTITSTVNGVASTASAVNAVSNGSSANNLTTTINGVSGTAVPMINSNNLTLSGSNITSTVNGVAAPALDITPAINSIAWSRAGNAATNAGTNFIGTTDAVDFVTRTNNAEKMRVTIAGNIGIGTTAPGQKLETMNGNLLINNNNNVSGEFRIAEPSTSGTNYTALVAGAQTANITYTLPPAQGGSGSQLTNDGSGNLYWTDGTVAIFKRKTANESVLLSNTLQDDNDFNFPFLANSTYEITMMLKVHCSQSGKIKMKMVSPAGSSAFMGALTTKGGNSSVTYMPSPTTAYTIAAAALNENSDIIVIQGTISTAGTSGTFKVQWAQDILDTDPTTIFAGSYCKAILMQ